MTPQDNFGSLGPVSLPKPQYRIGQRVDRSCLDSEPYYRRQLLRTEIANLRKTFEKIKYNARVRDKIGFVPGVPQKHPSNQAGGRLLDGHKRMIREIMEMFDKAEVIEICGIVSVGAQANVHISNQCYLRSGLGWSGVSWYYNLMLRSTTPSGNNVCYMPGSLRISETHIKVLPDV